MIKKKGFTLLEVTIVLGIEQRSGAKNLFGCWL
ncbi:type II secretion system protein [Escherichia coli]|nr:type II secretion system protein [Escherichia coli]ELO2819375.1 type II secretion system protein [Escherichia coli]